MVKSSLVSVSKNRPGRSTGWTRKRAPPFPNRPEGGRRSFPHLTRASESAPMNEVTQILSDLARADAHALPIAAPPVDDDLVALVEALTRLARVEPQKAELVKLRYFVGLTIEETAAALGISPATAKRHWAYSKAWLLQAMAGGEKNF